MSAFRTPVLLYHHVEPAPLEPPPVFAGNYVPLAEFRSQLDSLARRGLKALTLSQALARTPGPATPRAVVLTFDDACTCFLRTILPELEARRMSATVFAVSGRIGQTNVWDEERGERREELLDREQLRTLAAAGIEIGCHSRSHVDLSRVPAGELESEVAGARRELEDTLGSPVETFCYPHARFDRASRAAVEAAGFHAAVSVWGVPGVSARDRFALPRVGVGPGESGLGFRLKSSRVYPLLRRLPRMGLTAGARRDGAREGYPA